MLKVRDDPIKCPSPCGKDAITKIDLFETAETEFVHAHGSCKISNEEMRKQQALQTITLPEAPISKADHDAEVARLHAIIDELQAKLIKEMKRNTELLNSGA